jgi:hypothetical protein
VAADCECGYSVNSTSSLQHEVFTDLIESDFLTIQDIASDTDWSIQRYWTSYDPSSGYYGENFTSANVVSNPLKYNYSLEEPTKSQLGGDAGLQLWVRSDIQSNGLIPCGQVKTTRDDIQYGSFRAGMKLTPVNGTCSAFFSVCQRFMILQSIWFRCISDFSNSIITTPKKSTSSSFRDSTPTILSPALTTHPPRST